MGAGTAVPWLSVIVPTYNGERFLGAALESIRNQWAEDIEIVAVDDGSTDGTLDLLRACARLLPVRILEPGRTGNWVRGSNVGLREAKGRYACFLHQDDLWLPGRIAALREELARQPALVLHSAIFIGPSGDRLGTWRCPLPARVSIDAGLLLERLLVQNFIALPSPVFDREAALRAGGMDESLWFTADWDLWLTLGRAGATRYLPSPLAAFRVHPASQTSARDTSREDRRRQHRVVLDRHLPHWKGPDRERTRIRAAAAFSIEVNVALAMAARREGFDWGPLLGGAARLGPRGLWRYLRDSRVLERVSARLRAH